MHKQDCNYILNAPDERKARLIEVSWGNEDSHIYEVDIQVIAYERQSLLRDITTVFANERVSVNALNTNTNPKTQTMVIEARLNVENTEKLSRVLAQMSQVNNVIEVKRKT